MGQVETGQGRDNNPLQWGPWRSCMLLWFRKFSLNVWQGISSPIHIEDLQAVAHPLAGILEMVFNVASSRHHSPSP